MNIEIFSKKKNFIWQHTLNSATNSFVYLNMQKPHTYLMKIRHELYTWNVFEIGNEINIML